MKREMITVLFCLMSLATVVSATITISSVDNFYNLGDTIYLTTKTRPSSISGFFEIALTCGNESLTIERFIANRFVLGEEQSTTTSFPLTPDYIGGLLGECKVLASIGSEQATTNPFKISNKIIVNPRLDRDSYNPNDPIVLTLDATKENGQLLEGNLEISGATSLTKKIEKGAVTTTFAMPRTTEAGTYNINLYVYDTQDTSQGTIPLNTANTSLSFNINQVATSIQTSLSAVEATPGQDFEFMLDLYDQSGKPMQAPLSIKIINTVGQLYQQIVTNPGEKTIINLGLNETPGDWRIDSSYDQASDSKEFTLKSIQKAEFKFSEGMLTVKNIGNALYNKTIEVKIGEKTQKLNLNIPVGEERKFSLKGPGEQKVIVTDGETTAEQSMFLTGRAISVEDFKQSFLGNYTLIWTFLIIVIASIAAVIIFRYRKLGKLKSRTTQLPMGGMQTQNTDKKMIDLTKPGLEGAQSNVELKGQKAKSTIVAIKIKNSTDLTQGARQKLNEVLEIAKQEKGMVELKEDHILIIFTPLVTRTINNESTAVKVAFNIMKKLEEHNKRFKEKIRYNIGVSSGDLVTSLQGKKLQYSAMGTTIILARRIADIGNEKLLVSDQVKAKLSREIRVNRGIIMGNNHLYEVHDVLDQTQNKERFQEILHRMKQEDSEKKGFRSPPHTNHTENKPQSSQQQNSNEHTQIHHSPKHTTQAAHHSGQPTHHINHSGHTTHSNNSTHHSNNSVHHVHKK